MAQHIAWGIIGTISTGLSIWCAMNGNPALAACFGSFVFLAIYPVRPPN